MYSRRLKYFLFLAFCSFASVIHNLRWSPFVWWLGKVLIIVLRVTRFYELWVSLRHNKKFCSVRSLLLWFSSTFNTFSVYRCIIFRTKLTFNWVSHLEHACSLNFGSGGSVSLTKKEEDTNLLDRNGMIYPNYNRNEMMHPNYDYSADDYDFNNIKVLPSKSLAPLPIILFWKWYVDELLDKWVRWALNGRIKK